VLHTLWRQACLKVKGGHFQNTNLIGGKLFYILYWEIQGPWTCRVSGFHFQLNSMQKSLCLREFLIIFDNHFHQVYGTTEWLLCGDIITIALQFLDFDIYISVPNSNKYANTVTLALRRRVQPHNYEMKRRQNKLRSAFVSECVAR